MAIDIVGLALELSVMVCLPLMVLRAAKSRDQKALRHPDRTTWLVLTICAGEMVVSGFVLEFVMTFFLPQSQLKQLPVPVQGMGFIAIIVGAIGIFWAGTKANLR